MERRRFSLGAVAAFAGIALSGCYHYGGYGHGRGHGPPPHAPAHGYRHRHATGVTLVFDHRLGVYAVHGHPYYFHGGHFYRHHGGVWHYSDGPKGPWRVAPRGRVPPGLQKKFHKDHPGRGRGRGY